MDAEIKGKANYTLAQIARIARRRQDPAWELATEDEMATMSEADESAARETMQEEPPATDDPK